MKISRLIIKNYRNLKDNVILAATNFGIGSVWLGTYPQMERVNAQKELFQLPENIIPHSIISFGYPQEPEELKIGSRSGYEDTQGYEQW